MENLNIMPFYTKVNSALKVSNVFVKIPNTQTLKEAKNIWVKNESGVLKPIWNYRWNTGNWSSCSVTCGGGTQTRSVTCTRNDNITKSDVFCSDISKPNTSQSCNTHSCATVDVGSCVYVGSGVRTSGETGEFSTRNSNLVRQVTQDYSVYKANRSNVYWLINFSWYDVAYTLRALITSLNGVQQQPMYLSCIKLVEGRGDFKKYTTTSVEVWAPDGNWGHGQAIFYAPVSWIGGDSYSGQARFYWNSQDIRDYSGNKSNIYYSEMLII